jgi:hypothetical protein
MRSIEMHKKIKTNYTTSMHLTIPAFNEIANYQPLENAAPFINFF